MTHHVHGHIHLLGQLLFAQLLRQLLGFGVRLENLLAVHLKDNVVAPLRVVAVQVIMFQQIVLQVRQMCIESGTVAIVKRMAHRVAKLYVFRVFLIIYICVAGTRSK